MRLPVLALLITLALVAVPAAASAAPVTYSVSDGGNAPSSVTIDGDQLTAIDIDVFVSSCADGGPSTYVMHADTLAAPAPITGETVHAEFDATDQAYPGSGMHIALDGTLSADRRMLTGTLTYSDLHSVFDSGCSPAAQPFAAIVKPATIPYDPGHAWTLFGGSSLRVDTAGGAITRLKADVPFTCDGGTWVNAVNFDTQAYGLATIPLASDGSFTLTLGVLDEYSVVQIMTMTGTVTAAGASVRFQVASTNVGGWAGDCSGDVTMKATPPAAAAPPATTPVTPPSATTPKIPITTTPPTGGRQVLANPRGPAALFDWGAIRIGRGATYLYYFVVEHLACSGGATHVRVMIPTQRVHTISCRRSAAFATAPVAAGVDYPLTAQAVRLRRGRIVRRGPRVLTVLHMRQANDGWQPVSRLPGVPPTR